MILDGGVLRLMILLSGHVYAESFDTWVPLLATQDDWVCCWWTSHCYPSQARDRPHGGRLTSHGREVD
jgi:hypothetical protein